MSAISVEITGGAGLERFLKRLAEKLDAPAHLRAGFLEDATYPLRQRGKSAKSRRKAARKGTPTAQSLHVAQVAFWNEFGTSRAPARPFFRQTIRRESGHWGPDLGKALKRTDYDVKRAFSLVGAEIKDELTETINQWPADNAPSTVKRKGFDHGLVDTGVMMRSVDFEVSGNG